MKPLKLVAANDTFGALQATIDMLEGKHALFVTPPEVNGLMPEVHGLQDEVSDEVALIVERSGSTGRPKRIELSANALLASATASAEFLGGHGQWLLTLPINFIAGMNMLIRSVVADSQPVMMNTQLPFTAEGFARAASMLTGEKRYTSLVPAQLSRLAKAAEQDDYLLSLLKRFDAILVGGQRPDAGLVNRLRGMGIKLVESYGMTETAGGCIYDGQALRSVEWKLDAGQIFISGPTLANGLGPWFQTNDLGESVEGRLKVLGRADRVIISGGLKVALDLVEEAAREIAGVADVVAVAMDSGWGQSVAIAYVGSPEVSFDSLAILSPAAKPQKVLRLEALPTLSAGKADLIAVSELFRQ